MNVSHLAVIVPVDGLPQDMEEANQEVWGTVTHLLLPHLGKCYAKFYPARKAWGYRVPETFGVVLGKITGFCVSILRRARRRQRPFISM